MEVAIAAGFLGLRTGLVVGYLGLLELSGPEDSIAGREVLVHRPHPQMPQGGRREQILEGCSQTIISRH